jgi:drug/metabolite transporter (DMT)-like permease
MAAVPGATRAGIAFASGCAVLSAAVFLWGKRVLGEISPLQLVTCVYTCSALFFITHRLLAIRAGRLRLDLAGVGSSAWIGLFDLIYNVSLFSALRSMTSSAHGFCSLLAEVAAIAMGILFLGERYRPAEALWMAIVAAGVVVIQLGPVGASPAGLAWIAAASLAAGLRTVIAKRALDSRSPAEVALVRTAIVALGLLAISAATGSLRVPSAAIAGHVVAMGFFGPFLNALAFYAALRRLTVGKVVILRMFYVVLIPIGAVVLYEQPLTAREIAGGAAVLAGCAMLVREKDRLAQRRATTPSPTRTSRPRRSRSARPARSAPRSARRRCQPRRQRSRAA